MNRLNDDITRSIQVNIINISLGFSRYFVPCNNAAYGDRIGIRKIDTIDGTARSRSDNHRCRGTYCGGICCLDDHIRTALYSSLAGSVINMCPG